MFSFHVVCLFYKFIIISFDMFEAFFWFNFDRDGDAVEDWFWQMIVKLRSLLIIEATLNWKKVRCWDLMMLSISRFPINKPTMNLMK